MARPIPLFLLAALVASAWAQKPKTPAQSVVGAWRYDVTTLKLELNKEAQKHASDPQHGKEAREMIQKMKASLTETLKTMTITFKGDHTLVITTTTSPNKLLGTWTVDGRSVKVLMTNVKQQTPHMELAKDGKHILTTYTDSSFGVGKVTLVRR